MKEQFCHTCKRVGCICPPEEDTPTPITKVERPQTKGRYEDNHLCFGCGHAPVCEVGRHTAELYARGWLVTIADCNQFDAFGEEESNDKND